LGQQQQAQVALRPRLGLLYQQPAAQGRQAAQVELAQVAILIQPAALPVLEHPAVAARRHY
jgi:hypothetical protein